MIISKKYAKKLVKSNKAAETCIVTEEDGRKYQALERYDVQRVDHYEI